MSDQYPPLDPKRVYELPHQDSDRGAADVVDLLVAHVGATLEIIGELTRREAEAAELIRTVRATFGK